MVKIQESGNKHYINIPALYVKKMKLKKGDELFPYLNDKNELVLRRIEEYEDD